MKVTDNMTRLADASEREQAATTFDRNVVVTAGAGTGKTRLLVDRLVHLLMRDPDLKVTQMIALTFTNKAANEMKLRLRERLESYIAARLDRPPVGPKNEESHGETRTLMQRYHLSKEALDRRAVESLRQIERSEIGTIHSFAAGLLRLYPMESGVDPQFVEDDGARFERLFDERWSVWLGRELSREGSREQEWKRVLRKVDLREVKALAVSLCSDTADLRRLSAHAHATKTPAAIVDWIKSLVRRTSLLLERHPEARGNEKLLRAAQEVLEGGLSSKGAIDCRVFDGDGDPLARQINKRLKGWPEADIWEAREIVRVARGLCRVDDALAGSLCDLLIPFAEDFRDAFTRAGLLSFDGLLVRARNLVRDHLRVREELKRRFTAILIDEFQDTDPIQYEILLYLAEEIGQGATDWKSVRLVPGKIFVVGDPKQSIYAFRRADIEAYLEVVEKIIKAQNGIECRLSTNFRSHGGILDVVNGLFVRLIQPEPGLQPSYVPIEPVPSRGKEVADRPLPFRGVTIRKIRGREQKLDIDLARRLEAENLSRWLDEEVLGKAEILDQDGKKTPVQPRHVAILLRKLTDVHHYLEPLRRRGLRYVVEGERHFYAVQEIIDAVNLLRAVDNPHDRLALVGVLRSPAGGATDAQIYELHRRGLLDYRALDRLPDKNGTPFPELNELYETLRFLHGRVRTLPVGEAVAHVFDSLPVRLLAAAAFHGEQSVANLEKLRQQAEVLGREGASTFKEVIARLGSRVIEITDEAESALAEETVDAIRILSIHKSKGLEFPVVVLAGCHTVPSPVGERAAMALQDWSTGLAGLNTVSYWSSPGLYIAEKTRAREREEQKRVLYVAMTRAREHLMISCVPIGRSFPDSYLSLIEETLGEEIAGAETSRTIAAGAGCIELQVVDESLSPPVNASTGASNERAGMDWPAYARLWRRRAKEREAALDRRPFLTPTLVKRMEAELTEAVPERRQPGVSSRLALQIGELTHRFLEHWDFTDDPVEFRGRLGSFLDRSVGSDRGDREELHRELEEILRRFFSSGAYRELSSSRILAREVPLLIPWNGRIMEGVIDLIYQREGSVYVADYKTDRIEEREVAGAMASYRRQAQIYTEAARRTLGRDVAGFKLIFLRLGEVYPISFDRPVAG